jgi:cytochrome c-type biogenesis protein CcmH/NrfG
MTRLPLGITLTILAGYAGIAQSAPLDAPLADVMGQLAPALATHDPARLSVAYRAMGNYGLPAADIVQSSVNASGYRHLENSEFDMAIAVFELNTQTFPDSANAWDSLGEAIMARGDHAAAIRYYRKSLELNPQNSNAALMIERLQGEAQLRQASNTES